MYFGDDEQEQQVPAQLTEEEKKIGDGAGEGTTEGTEE